MRNLPRRFYVEHPIMKSHHVSLLALTLVFLGVPALAQDFDPNGRHKHPTPPAHPSGHPGAAHPHPPGSSTAATSATPDAGATNAVLIDRYTKIVLSQPGSPFPLQRLAQLYREKDGNLTKLVIGLREARARDRGRRPVRGRRSRSRASTRSTAASTTR